MIVFRTILFVSMILYKSENALFAFSVAQLASTLFYTISHYIFFYWYIKKIDNDKKKFKKYEIPINHENSDDNFDNEFPFKSIFEFLPGYMNNRVIINLSF